jgi:hypothetical protein
MQKLIGLQPNWRFLEWKSQVGMNIRVDIFLLSETKCVSIF